MKNKPTFGDTIIEGLTEFADALHGNEPLTKRFNCRRITVDLDPTKYDPVMVRQTREILKATQAVFAKFLGVSTRTVQAWENGSNAPNDMASRFMDEIRRDPKYWRLRFKAIRSTKSDRSVGTATGAK